MTEFRVFSPEAKRCTCDIHPIWTLAPHRALVVSPPAGPPLISVALSPCIGVQERLVRTTLPTQAWPPTGLNKKTRRHLTAFQHCCGSMQTRNNLQKHIHSKGVKGGEIFFFAVTAENITRKIFVRRCYNRGVWKIRETCLVCMYYRLQG